MANRRVADEVSEAALAAARLAAKDGVLENGSVINQLIADGSINTINTILPGISTCPGKPHKVMCMELRNYIRQELKCNMQSHEVADVIYRACDKLDAIELRHLEEEAYLREDLG